MWKVNTLSYFIVVCSTKVTCPDNSVCNGKDIGIYAYESNPNIYIGCGGDEPQCFTCPSDGHYSEIQNKCVPASQ